MFYEVIGKMLANPVQSSATAAVMCGALNYMYGRFKGREPDPSIFMAYTKNGASVGACMGVLASAYATRNPYLLGAAAINVLASYCLYDKELKKDNGDLMYHRIAHVAGFGTFVGAVLCSAAQLAMSV